MNFSEKRRSNYIKKAKEHFAFLIHDYEYELTEQESSDTSDELHYLNKKNDRLIVLSNQYHPNDYGFEVQFYKPSTSTNHPDREMPLYRLKEDQDEDSNFLSEMALSLEENFKDEILGLSWDFDKDNLDDIRRSFEEELEKVKDSSVLSPEFRKKKVAIWCIRTAITVTLYILFWEYEWVRWTLLLYIPLSLLSLISIYGWNYFLKRKIRSTYNKIDEAEQTIRESENE